MRSPCVYRMSENGFYTIIIYEIPRSVEGNMVSDNHPSEFYSPMFLPVLSGRCRVEAARSRSNFEGSRLSVIESGISWRSQIGPKLIYRNSETI